LTGRRIPNNPNVPAIGIAANAPVGTGIELSGSQNDLVYANRIVRQGAWGILLHFFPDSRNSVPPFDHCQGGTVSGTTPTFPAFGNDIRDNLPSGNGFFGNPWNGDLAEATAMHDPGNCWRGNHRQTGQGPVSSDPANVQQTQGSCANASGGDLSGPLFGQIVCDAQFFGPCAPSAGHYPRTTRVRMLAVPRHQPTMPNPCAGVPSNPWCPGARRAARRRVVSAGC
jgi:hypothetical protein